MLSKLINTLTVWAAAVLLLACGQHQESSAPGATTASVVLTPTAAVRIGHVGPVSGAVSHLGKDSENGARMAIEELNAQGVLIHGQVVTLELMAEDDAADSRLATRAAQKLVDARVAGVVGHLNSGATLPASKLYSDAGIPQLAPSSTSPRYTRQGFKTTFRLVADDAQLGMTLGKYAVGTLKAKAIVVIDDRAANGQGLAAEFSKAVVAAGGKVVLKEFTTDQGTNFNATLTAIKGKKPDLVFFSGMDAAAGPMLKQMKSLGIRAKFMGGDGICSAELLKLAGDAIADDAVFCAEAGGVEGAARAELDAFKARFKTKYGTDVQIFAPYGYDAVKILVAAMVKAESADPAKYRPLLAATSNYKGVTGSVTFDGNGGIKNGAVTLKTIRAGRFETLALIR